MKGQQKVSELLEDQSMTTVVDPIPVPVVKLAREKTSKAFRKSSETAPAKGYSAVNRGWFIGYKLHVIIFDTGVVQQSGITKGSLHDITFLKSTGKRPSKKLLLGARAYRSYPLQMDRFDKYGVELKVPYRINQTDYKKHPGKSKAKRQMGDQLNLKRNHAKSYEGLAARLTSKLSSMSLLHWINYQKGRKPSQIKHALSF